MYNRKYEKIYIAMKPDKNDAEHINSKAFGSAVIEIRNGAGKINISAAGLKEENLSAYLIAADNYESFGTDLGRIKADNNGFNLKYIFDPENVNGSGLAIEAFNTVALMNDARINPLTGYIEKERPWKGNFTLVRKEKALNEGQPKAMLKKADQTVEKPDIKTEEPNEKEKPETVEYAKPDEEKVKKSEEAKEEDNKTGKAMKAIAEEEKVYGNESRSKNVDDRKIEIIAIDRNKVSSDNKYHDTFKEIARKFKKELEALEAVGILTSEEIAIIKNEDEQTKIHKKRTDKNAEKNANDSFETGVFERCPKLYPFDKEASQWIRICREELYALPLRDISLAKDIFVVYSNKKYKHLILSRKADGDGFVLGLPDEYCANDRMRAARLGFNEFKSIDGQKVDEGVKGYWLKDIN